MSHDESKGGLRREVISRNRDGFHKYPQIAWSGCLTTAAQKFKARMPKLNT